MGDGGKSPAAARAIREDFDGKYGRDWADLVDLLGEHRELMKGSVKGHRRRAQLWKKILDDDLLGTLRRRGRKEASRVVRETIAGASGKEKGT